MNYYYYIITCLNPEDNNVTKHDGIIFGNSPEDAIGKLRLEYDRMDEFINLTALGENGDYTSLEFADLQLIYTKADKLHKLLN